MTGAAPCLAPGSEARSRAGGVLQERTSLALCSEGGLPGARGEPTSCGPLLAPALCLCRPQLLPEEAFLTRDQPTGSPHVEEREAGGLQLSKA